MIKYKNKVVSAAYALIISMGLLSCNMTNDKQEMGLSPKEKQEAFQEAKGEYKGFVYFDDRKTSDNVLTLDSAEVTINILTDSTMVIHDMPSKVLVAKVAPSNLKTAVTKYGKFDINCKIDFTEVDPMKMVVAPLPISFNVNYIGTAKKYETGFLGFLFNRKVSGAALKRGILMMQIIQSKIMLLDGTTETNMASRNFIKFKLSKVVR